MRASLQIVTASAMILLASPAPAVVYTVLPTTVTASTPNYSGNLSALNDGYFPPNGTSYTTDSVHDFTFPTYFTFDFGSVVNITALRLNVDNNDFYRVFFTGGPEDSQGAIFSREGVVNDGVETFSSTPDLPGTLTENFVLPVRARYAAIQGQGGDNRFSIGEFQFFTSPSAVPEPATWAMMLSAGAFQRKRENSGCDISGSLQAIDEATFFEFAH